MSSQSDLESSVSNLQGTLPCLDGTSERQQLVQVPGRDFTGDWTANCEASDLLMSVSRCR